MVYASLSILSFWIYINTFAKFQAELMSNYFSEKTKLILIHGYLRKNIANYIVYNIVDIIKLYYILNFHWDRLSTRSFV